jgi:hypothetical protein
MKIAFGKHPNDWMKQLRGKMGVHNADRKIFYGLCIEVIVPTKCTVLNIFEH